MQRAQQQSNIAVFTQKHRQIPRILAHLKRFAGKLLELFLNNYKQ
jgi:hypothetical protein